MRLPPGHFGRKDYSQLEEGNGLLHLQRKWRNNSTAKKAIQTIIVSDSKMKSFVSVFIDSINTKTKENDIQST